MLLQEIYAREAMSEAGITGSLEIVHAEQPKTIVNGKDYGLLFPKRIFQSKPKDIEMLFVGKHTYKRAAFLANFPEATIIYTDRGRDNSIKGHDAEYWDMMSRAKYVLCPDGDFVWTYRFFEAVACGAVPIIETQHDFYYRFWCYSQIPPIEGTYGVSELNSEIILGFTL
jgi:hypothetical protein